jgi:hypothetical protein
MFWVSQTLPRPLTNAYTADGRSGEIKATVRKTNALLETEWIAKQLLGLLQPAEPGVQSGLTLGR